MEYNIILCETQKYHTRRYKKNGINRIHMPSHHMAHNVDDLEKHEG